MPHTCKEINCNNNVFGGGFCKYHQYKRKMRGGDQYERKPKKQASIKKRSEKRAKDERYYAVQAKEFFEESDKVCIFCGYPVIKYQGLHHWKGRKNDYLLDKEWWSVVHNSCHVEKYHRLTVEQLSLEPWYNEFLSRLKSKSEELYYKQITKKDKNEVNLFDD